MSARGAAPPNGGDAGGCCNLYRGGAGDGAPSAGGEGGLAGSAAPFPRGNKVR